MSHATLDALLRQLAAAPAIQGHLNRATTGIAASDAAETTVAIAYEAGHSISRADLAGLTAAMTAEDKLSDEAFDEVAGGRVGRHAIFEIFAGDPDHSENDPQRWENLQGR